MSMLLLSTRLAKQKLLLSATVTQRLLQGSTTTLLSWKNHSTQTEKSHFQRVILQGNHEQLSPSMRFQSSKILSSLELPNKLFRTVRKSPGGITCRHFSSSGSGQPWVNPSNQVPGENLKLYGIDLTKMAKDGKLDPVIGRHDEIRRTLQILARRTKNNPVLIGEPGVGKVRYFARD